MTRTEQLRLLTWRLKVLREAEAGGNVCRTCRHFGISRKAFTNGRSATRRTATPACVTARGRRTALRAPHHERW